MRELVKPIMAGMVIGIVAGVLLFSVTWASGKTQPNPHRATYIIREDLYGYPYRLKLTHCDPNPDRLVRLNMVSFDRATNTVVYRCVRS